LKRRLATNSPCVGRFFVGKLEHTLKTINDLSWATMLELVIILQTIRMQTLRPYSRYQSNDDWLKRIVGNLLRFDFSIPKSLPIPGWLERNYLDLFAEKASQSFGSR
jgi:hypothetical protein